MEGKAVHITINITESCSCNLLINKSEISQKTHPRAKLVRVLTGEVFDAAVDIRKNGSTYGKWVGALLSAENKKPFFIPRGLAHGFLVLSDTAEFAYKCDEFYHPEDGGGIRWNDPTIGIAWHELGCEYLLSEKDRS